MDKKVVWNWKKNEKDFWLRPVTHTAYLGQRWLCSDKKTILDVGCGLGRNLIYFAKQYGFRVTGIDNSEYAINYVKQAAMEENVAVDVIKDDMFNMPFKNGSFDCVFAYDVTSHLTSEQFLKVLSEINRVVKQGGEIYITLLSKSSANYKNAKPENMLDENTVVIHEEDGTQRYEFYVDINDIMQYFGKYEFVDEIMEYNIYNYKKCDVYTKYFGILIRKK